MKSLTKTLFLVLVFVLAPLALLGLLYGWVVLRSQAPDSGDLVRTADRRLVWTGDPVEVRLHINSDKEIPSQRSTESRKPYVIGLAIDHSGSMGSGYESPLEAAKTAAMMFARTTAASDQPVGAVAFDDGLMQVCSPSVDSSTCVESIGRIPPGGGTDIANAVEAAHSMVRNALNSGQFSNAVGMIVLLSDGQSNRSSALQAADRAKADQIRIVTIGLGTQIDEELLRGMASSEADFHFTLDPNSLGDIYSNIAGDFGTVIGYNGQLTEQFHYGAFDLARPPAGFRTTTGAEKGRMDIRMPLIFQQRLTIPYTLRARKVGLWGLALKRAELTYIPDRNKPEPRTYLTNLAPPILVVSWWLFPLLYLPSILYALWRIWRWILNRSVPIPVPEPEPIKILPASPPLKLRKPEPIRPREPQPILFVALGDVGGRVLEHISRLLSHDRYLREIPKPPFHLLHVDVRSGNPLTAPDPRFSIEKLQMPSAMNRTVRDLQDNSKWPDHLRWVPRAEAAHAAGAQLDLSKGSNGLRWIARLSLFEAFARQAPAFWGPWNQAVGWLKEHRDAQIVLVGSLESGTGSAVLQDVAFLLRQAQPPSYRAPHHVYALALADVPAEHAYDRVNQHAFLEELERLIVASEIPQPAVYHPKPATGLEYLNSRIEEPVFDRFFLLQFQDANAALLDRELLSSIAVFAHTLTEHSFADRIEAHFGEVRGREQDFNRKRFEGTLSSAWQYQIRFPLPELTRRLACRFIMEILGKNRLVGVAISPDGRRFDPPPQPENPLQEAIHAWQYLTKEEQKKASIYTAYCQAAVSKNARAATPAIRSAAAVEPTIDDFRRELHELGTRWFDVLLNGSPQQTEPERCQWRSHKLLLLHGALAQLIDYSAAALEIEKQRFGARTTDSGKITIFEMISEIQQCHERWFDQTRGWLQTLVDSEFATPAAEGFAAGLYRKANDENKSIGQRLEQENSAYWQKVLLDTNIANPELREDALYERCFRGFLDKEQGFLSRWRWKISDEGQGRTPQLQLHAITDQDRAYLPTPQGTEALFHDLLSVADSQTSELDKITSLLDALRSPTGELQLTPLAHHLASRTAGNWGLKIDRQFPGADQIQRHIFAMVPAIEEQELFRFEAELRRILPYSMTSVRHGDPYSMRLLMIESLIPVKAARVRRESGAVLAACVFTPEQEGERLRREIEDNLGRIPCPPIHPIIRLLASAPRPRREWVGILAEDCIHSRRPDGIHPTLVMECDDVSEPVVASHQEQSWIWAVVNIAYKLRAVDAAQSLLDRWNRRTPSDIMDRLNNVVRDWQQRTGEASSGSPEQSVLEQIALIIELEAHIQQRKYEERGT